LNQFLPIVFSDPNNLRARGGVLLGASHAGAAIEQSMLGAAHSMANPLTAKYGTIHGIAVGLALPLVIKFNMEESECCKTYANFARVSGLSKDDCSEMEGAEILVSRIEDLLSLSKISTYQNGMDFEKSAIPKLATSASKQWTASFNPRPVQAADFEVLYEQLFQNSLEDSSIITEVV
jgi:alcohol dehydrogenase